LVACGAARSFFRNEAFFVPQVKNDHRERGRQASIFTGRTIVAASDEWSLNIKMELNNKMELN